LLDCCILTSILFVTWVFGRFDTCIATCVGHRVDTWVLRRLDARFGHSNDSLIGCVGTGGTFRGCGQYLKFLTPGVQWFAVQPVESAVLLDVGWFLRPDLLKSMALEPALHSWQCRYVVILDRISGEDAMTIARCMATQGGIFVGFVVERLSWAAVQVGQRPENQGQQIAYSLSQLVG
jgi:cysteine synthase A